MRGYVSSGTVMSYVIFGLFLLGAIYIFGGYASLGLKTVSAQNFERNYESFKVQETAMRQLTSQICQAKFEQSDFTRLHGNSTGNWSRQEQMDYSDLIYVKNGYISKYNSLVSDYNAQRASFIRSFGRDPNIPVEYRPFYEAQCG